MHESNFVVVRNDAGHYSIWGADRPLPAGWSVRMGPAPKLECLQFIDTAWTELRSPESAHAQPSGDI